MTPVPLTLLFAGCCALLQVGLTFWVTARRVQTGIAFQDGGDKSLMRRIRAHGNFTETVPMALLLMGLLELSGLARSGLTAFGVALLVGRVMHAVSLLGYRAHWMRVGGMVLTLAVISLEGVCALWIVAQ